MAAFEVTFGCGNCGREWSETFGAGDRIKSEYDASPYLESHACTHTFTCTACRRINCRQCGSEKDVRVKSRKPIGLLDGAQVQA